MRIIKFIAKDFGGVWYYGSLGYSNIHTKIYFQTGKGSVKRMDWVYVNQETIGQFTGLYDAHGKGIYEGDILKWKADNLLYAVIFIGVCSMPPLKSAIKGHMADFRSMRLQMKRVSKL